MSSCFGNCIPSKARAASNGFRQENSELLVLGLEVININSEAYAVAPLSDLQDPKPPVCMHRVPASLYLCGKYVVS